MLDGGTDWGHPDLINTWQTWSSDDVSNDNDFVDPGWVGWPKAFDPYSTLVLEMLGPDAVAENDSWYTTTQAATCTYVKKNGQPAKKIDKDTLCAVTFATRTGPARNFSAPAGTNAHTYTFPASWTKSGTVKLTSHPDDYLLQLYGERPAVLVTDPNQAGVYDTVYVDLNDDHSFGDEKPVTKSSPVSYRDIDGDGYADLSGGLLYYISDGHTTIPGGPTDFGDAQTPASGDFLAWSGDFDPGIEGHGTLTASNVVGQAVINGKAPHSQTFPAGTGTRAGRSRAWCSGAPRTRSSPRWATLLLVLDLHAVRLPVDERVRRPGDLELVRHLDLRQRRHGRCVDRGRLDPQRVRQRDHPGLLDGQRCSGLRHGHGSGPGERHPGRRVDELRLDRLGLDRELLAGDRQRRDRVVEPRAGRQRTPGGRRGRGRLIRARRCDAEHDPERPERLGDVGWHEPLDAGHSRRGRADRRGLQEGARLVPDRTAVKVFLKSGAKDLGYEPWIQGAGSVDAGKSVAAAGGSAPTVSPTEWRPGTSDDPDHLGRARFPVTIAPGGSASQSFSLGGSASGWTVGDRVLEQYVSDSFNFQSQSESQESTSNFDVPDYLIDITNKIKAHPDADIVVIRATYPWSEFDGNGDNHSDQAWRLLAYNWTDVNHDGKLWTDKNGNGVVNHEELNSSSNIDNFNDVNWKKSEIEQGEYERFFYHRPGSNVLMGFIRQPAKQMANGIFLGFQHSTRNPAIDKTDFRIEIDYYKNVDWDWATETTPSGGSFTATVNVPSNAPTGMYEGAITATKGSPTIAVPVSVTVAPTIVQNDDGSIAEALHFGGTDVAKAQASSLYDNGSIFGANDWTWREESGDWRFFWFNVQNPVPDGTLFLSDTTWDDAPTRRSPTSTRCSSARRSADRRSGHLRGRCVLVDRHGRREPERLPRQRHVGLQHRHGRPRGGRRRSCDAGPERRRATRRALRRRQVQRAVLDDARVALGEPDVGRSDGGGRRHGHVRRDGGVEPRPGGSQRRRVRSEPARVGGRPRDTGRPVRVRSELGERQGRSDRDRRPCLPRDVHAAGRAGRRGSRLVRRLRREQRRAVHERRDRRLFDRPRRGERGGDADRSGGRQLPGMGVRLPGERRRQHSRQHRRDRRRAGRRHRDREPAQRAASREYALHAAPELQRGHRTRRLRGRAPARPDRRAVRGHGADHDPPVRDGRRDAGGDDDRIDHDRLDHHGCHDDRLDDLDLDDDHHVVGKKK